MDLSHSDDSMVSDTDIIKLEVPGMTSEGSNSDSVSVPTRNDRKKKSPSSRKGKQAFIIFYSLLGLEIQQQRATQLSLFSLKILVKGL